MIRKPSYINEAKLCKFIGGDRDIVNLKEDYFEFCNGFIIVNCTYEMDQVIQKLFRIGAISNYKEWKPRKEFDLSSALECKTEVDATRTGYLKQANDRLFYVFKIKDKYITFDKNYVDIFENVTYKAEGDESEYPKLRIYRGDKLVGSLMPVRDDLSLFDEIIDRV